MDSLLNEKQSIKKGRRQMHVDSTQVEDALNPVRGVRDALRRRGIQPTNHSRQNIQAVKRMSQMNARRKQESIVQQDSIPRRMETRLSTVRRPQMQKEILEEDLQNNFVLRNIVEVGSKHCQVKSQISGDGDQPESWMKKECYGKIPSYLQTRKLELLNELEAREQAKEASLCPEGMRIMPDHERMEALEKIQNNKVDVEAELHNLPLIIETPTLTNMKTSLERRLMELEEAEKIFSRPKVIVKT